MAGAGPAPGLSSAESRRAFGQRVATFGERLALAGPTTTFRRAVPGGLGLFSGDGLGDGRGDGLNHGDGGGLLRGLAAASPRALTALSWGGRRGLLHHGGQLDVLNGGRQGLLFDGRGGDQRWRLALLDLLLTTGLVGALTVTALIAPVAPTATPTAAFASGGAVVV